MMLLLWIHLAPLLWFRLAVEGISFDDDAVPVLLLMRHRHVVVLGNVGPRATSLAVVGIDGEKFGGKEGIWRGKFSGRVVRSKIGRSARRCATTGVGRNAGDLKVLKFFQSAPATNNQFDARMNPIPGIGEHTKAILKELGVSESTVAKLLADKAI